MWFERRSAPRDRCRQTRKSIHRWVERLDDRRLLSIDGGTLLGGDPFLEAEPNDTLDLAQWLGDGALASQVEVLGAVGDGIESSADVDWFRFQLGEPAFIRLEATTELDSITPILGLFNSSSDPFTILDPFTPLNHRLIAQSGEAAVEGRIEQMLSAGTYFVAVSGAGNHYFHPFLANSGMEGEAASYQLGIEVESLGHEPGDGPGILSAVPERDAVLSQSPFVLRVSLDDALDHDSVLAGTTVRLLRNGTGEFLGQDDEEVALTSVIYSSDLGELQIIPTSALGPGYYRILLAGDSSQNEFVLRSVSGIALEADEAHPSGKDVAIDFSIVGTEGRSQPGDPADDTPVNATELDDPTGLGPIQIVAAIGDDPYYRPDDPESPTSRASDVDLYHFRISGPGRSLLVAEVFAGRFGSPADPGISLFVLNPATGNLDFLDGNNNTRNPARGSNDWVPLFTDSLLNRGLTAGDYYLAVTSNDNSPSPIEELIPGVNGVFDPNSSHSGMVNGLTGPYVLNVEVTPDDQPPAVVQSSPAAGETLDQPPTSLTVRFDEAVNLRKLVFLAFDRSGEHTVSAVFIEGEDGSKYFPRLQSYDETTHEARFQMLDALPSGNYTWHLSGGLGLTDLAGNPLLGDDPDADWTTPFTVDSPPRGQAGSPTHWSREEPNASSDSPQILGVLFPRELETGVTISRSPSQGGDPDLADWYRFEVLQSQTHYLLISNTSERPGTESPEEPRVEITDLEGNPIPTSPDEAWGMVIALNPGSYLIRVDGWTVEQSNQVGYELRIGLLGLQDNAPPLSTNPGAVLRFRFASVADEIGYSWLPTGDSTAAFGISQSFPSTPATTQPIAQPRVIPISSTPISSTVTPVPVSVSAFAADMIPEGLIAQWIIGPLGGLSSAQSSGTVLATQSSSTVHLLGTLVPSLSAIQWSPSLPNSRPVEQLAMGPPILLEGMIEKLLSQALSLSQPMFKKIGELAYEWMSEWGNPAMAEQGSETTAFGGEVEWTDQTTRFIMVPLENSRGPTSIANEQLLASLAKPPEEVASNVEFNGESLNPFMIESSIALIGALGCGAIEAFRRTRGGSAGVAASRSNPRRWTPDLHHSLVDRG